MELSLLWEHRCAHTYSALAFSPQEDVVALTVDERREGGIEVRDAGTGQIVRTYGTSYPTAERTGSAYWENGQSMQAEEVEHYLGRPVSLAFSPDGSLLAAGYAYTNQQADIGWFAPTDLGEIQVWSRDGAPCDLIALHCPAKSLAWSPERDLLAYGSSGSAYDEHAHLTTISLLRVIDLSHKRSTFYHEGKGADRAPAWSPDGRFLAYIGGMRTQGADDGEESSIILCDTHRRSHRQGSPEPCISVYRGHTAAVTEVAWASDGSRIASAGYDRTVQVWRPEGTPIEQVEVASDGACGLTWSSDGRHLLWMDSLGCHAWDAHSGHQENSLFAVHELETHWRMKQVAWSTHHSKLAMLQWKRGEADHRVSVWSL
jgi:WD40 repeat protein